MPHSRCEKNTCTVFSSCSEGTDTIIRFFFSVFWLQKASHYFTEGTGRLKIQSINLPETNLAQQNQHIFLEHFLNMLKKIYILLSHLTDKKQNPGKNCYSKMWYRSKQKYRTGIFCAATTFTFCYNNSFRGSSLLPDQISSFPDFVKGFQPFYFFSQNGK